MSWFASDTVRTSQMLALEGISFYLEKNYKKGMVKSKLFTSEFLVLIF